MSSMALAVVLLVAGASSEAVRTAAAVPEAVLVHPAAARIPPDGTPRWRRSAQDFAAWSGPSVQHPNLYDQRYVTW
jgi:hypothetical protein